ncbi:MAG: hypothetical protein KJZ75_11560 [Hyphomonadaceae bacterium]|nr:hypothetical protein [Hyphomonadaceae bacterium]
MSFCDPSRDWSHLDFWRIQPLGIPAYRLGAVDLEVNWTAKDHAFVRYLIPTPRHGCLWTDAEALGFIGAAIPKEASKTASRINRKWREALAVRARDKDFAAGQLVRSFQTKSGGYAEVPQTITRGFAFHDGVAWLSAFRAALRGGVTGAEVARLNALVGNKGKQRWRVSDLRETAPIHVVSESHSCERYAWKGMTPGQPIFDAIVKLAEINNDDAFHWGDLEIGFGWGWLSNRKRSAA